MRIVFMGSPDFAVPSLNVLVEAEHKIVAAYCQPPRPAGRGKAERKTAVHERAEELGGAFTAERDPAGGTVIHAVLPFAHIQADAVLP